MNKDSANMRVRNLIMNFILVVFLVGLIAMPVLADTGGPITVVGNDFVVESGTIYNNDIVVIGGNLTLQANSQVNGQVAVTGGDVDIAGNLNGNLVVLGGTVRLQSSATVNGDIISPGNMDRANGATVNGQIVSGAGAAMDLRLANRLVSLGSESIGSQANGIVRFFATLFLAGLYILFAVLIYLLWPARVLQISATTRASWLASLGAGLLTLLVVIVLVPILVVTCIGIPVAMVLLAALLIALLAGTAAIGKQVGQFVFSLLKASEAPAIEVITGSGILVLFTLIPCIGWLVGFLVGAVGLGATVLTRLGSSKYPLPAQPNEGAVPS
ncbi:MAG: bactofilin family protein [Anaerolineae bacterium]